MESPKLIFRSARLSTGRKESVADHSWRLALMAFVIVPKLKKKINLETILKMALIHDLGEIKAGDVPSHIHYFDKDIAKLKYKNELAAMIRIKKDYPDFGGEIYNLWHEYEKQETLESKVIKALDKLDARIQTIDDKKTANYSSIKIKKSYELTSKTDDICRIDMVLAELNRLSKSERFKKFGF